MPARTPLLALAALVAAALALLAAPAAPAAPPEEWRALAREIANPWPGLQDPEGWYRDYVYGDGKAFCGVRQCREGLGNARYGESVMGYGLVMTGIRENDQRLIDSGLRAISYIVRQENLQRDLPTSFEGMAVASTYNLMREKRPTDPLFLANRAAWESFMRRQPLVTTIYRNPDTTRYANHYLVEALEILELLKTGLSSSDPNAILGGKRAEAERITLFLLNERVPGIGRRAAIPVRGQSTWLHSDPADNPLPYYGLTTGFYARAVRALGDRAHPRTRQAVIDGANTAPWVTAPDGDMAYFGRSHQDSWALSFLANAVETAANTPGSSSAQDARYRAVTDRVLARLRDAYGNGPKGLWILPALREDLARGLPGVDSYTGAVAFAGLTLVALQWSLEEMEETGDRQASALGSDRDSAVTISRGESRLALVRDGDVWFAVKRQPSSKRVKDLRYDFGVIALKRREGERWVDVLRQRPNTAEEADSAGPVLRLDGREGRPRGTTMSIRNGIVSVAGQYRDGRRVVRTGGRWTFRASRCGVIQTWLVRRGDRFELSTFFRDDGSPPRLSGRVLADETQRVTFSVAPTRVGTERGYISGLDPALVRSRAILAAPRNGTLSVETCGR